MLGRQKTRKHGLESAWGCLGEVFEPSGPKGHPIQHAKTTFVAHPSGMVFGTDSVVFGSCFVVFSIMHPERYCKDFVQFSAHFRMHLLSFLEEAAMAVFAIFLKKKFDF